MNPCIMAIPARLVYDDDMRMRMRMSSGKSITHNTRVETWHQKNIMTDEEVLKHLRTGLNMLHWS